PWRRHRLGLYPLDAFGRHLATAAQAMRGKPATSPVNDAIDICATSGRYLASNFSLGLDAASKYKSQARPYDEYEHNFRPRLSHFVSNARRALRASTGRPL